MKKLLIPITVACALFLFSYKTEEKQLKVELTLNQWTVILNQLDNSNSPHAEIKVTTKWVVDQLKSQLDSTKK